MKVVELANYVLHYGINQLENYPGSWEGFDVIDGLETIDRIVEHLEKENWESEFYDPEFQARELELEPTEWADLLDLYTKKDGGAVHCLIESLRDGTF